MTPARFCDRRPGASYDPRYGYQGRHDPSVAAQRALSAGSASLPLLHEAPRGEVLPIGRPDLRHPARLGRPADPSIGPAPILAPLDSSIRPLAVFPVLREDRRSNPVGGTQRVCSGKSVCTWWIGTAAGSRVPARVLWSVGAGRVGGRDRDSCGCGETRGASPQRGWSRRSVPELTDREVVSLHFIETRHLDDSAAGAARTLQESKGADGTRLSAWRDPARWPRACGILPPWRRGCRRLPALSLAGGTEEAGAGCASGPLVHSSAGRTPCEEARQ